MHVYHSTWYKESPSAKCDVIMVLVFSGPTTKKRKVEKQMAPEELIIGKLFLNFPCIEVPRYIGGGTVF